jgi:outer membrane biosynthesis protein TonB
MEDFNLPDPQNERRAAQPASNEPVTPSTPPVQPSSPQQYQQPVTPPPTPQYQQPVNPPQYQQPQQPAYQQPQQQYQQPQYQQPQPTYQQQTQYQQPQTSQQMTYNQQVSYQKKNNLYPPMKMGEWMLTMFLAGIPLVGFIMMLVWAFSSDTNPSKSAWAKASLLWGVILSVVWVIFYAIFFVVLGMANNMNLNF